MNNENNNSQKTLKVSCLKEIPNDYTGIVQKTNNYKRWYLNGKLHRTDGPAVERANGDKVWWMNGIRINQQ